MSEGYKVYLLEGPGGCGKTTLFNKLKPHFDTSIHFPLDSTPEGKEKLSELTKQDAIAAATMMFDEQVSAIINAIDGGAKTILLDRGWVSTIAYQFPFIEGRASCLALQNFQLKLALALTLRSIKLDVVYIPLGGDFDFVFNNKLSRIKEATGKPASSEEANILLEKTKWTQSMFRQALAGMRRAASTLKEDLFLGYDCPINDLWLDTAYITGFLEAEDILKMEAEARAQTKGKP